MCPPERSAPRARLVEGRRPYLLDQVGRAFGILTHARVLQAREAVDLLSGLRLGVELGFVRNLDVATINEIMLLTQPGHLQKTSGKVLSPEERDQVRAGLVRSRIGKTTIVE